MKANYDGLESLLKANNMTKTSLLKKADVPTSVLSAIKHSKPLPMPSALVLSRYFCCDISEIMTLVFEEEDYIEFKLSVFREMLADAKCKDVTPFYDGNMFVFVYHAPDGSDTQLMSVTYDGVPMGRHQMKEDAKMIIQFVIKGANRKKDLHKAD